MNIPESKAIEKSNFCWFNDRYLNLVRELVKYGSVSVLALGVDAGLLYFLVDYFGIHYLSAATIAFSCGLIVNYCLARIFVFQNSKLPPVQEFIWYASIGGIGLILNDLIIYILVWINIWYLYAKVASVAVVFFFNFFSRRRLFVCSE